MELVKEIVRILDEKKASDIEVIKISDLTALADYLVVCTGSSTTQVKALANEVEERVDKEGKMAYHKEGYQTANWVLLDYGDVIVNVFHPESRDFYQLENMWADGERVPIEGFLN